MGQASAINFVKEVGIFILGDFTRRVIRIPAVRVVNYKRYLHFHVRGSTSLQAIILRLGLRTNMANDNKSRWRLREESLEFFKVYVSFFPFLLAFYLPDIIHYVMIFLRKFANERCFNLCFFRWVTSNLDGTFTAANEEGSGARRVDKVLFIVVGSGDL